MSFLIQLIQSFIQKMLALLSFGQKTITNSLSIYIKTNTGRTLSVNLEPQWDIKNVKEIVAPQLGLQPEEVKIIFAGKELSDATTIQECDLGQQSILHAIRSRPQPQRQRLQSTVMEEEPQDIMNISTSTGRATPSPPEEPSKPLCETLVDLQLLSEERINITEEDRQRTKAHFFVHCAQCNKLCKGKLRVRCSLCKGGAFTVHRDPECWDDVLKPRRITGHCESQEIACFDNETGDPPYTEFYFKCGEHVSGGEKDFAAPLNLIKINIKDVPCLACTEISETVLVFPCESKHVTCLECFEQYCRSRLSERQFMPHPDIGYTLPCPAGCENSFIEEIHHFKLLSREEYARYQRFATEEYVLQAGGVLCPQPGCGMGLLVEPECKKVTCQNGCGYVFCRNCLQGYHLGDCLPEGTSTNASGSCEYSVDPNRAAEARWDEASKVTIKVMTKPCPKCRTPTERDGGCMHMVCTRAGCGFEWCWICQTEWTRDCMGAHWFG
ncbi:E3 ubiquitin-protein ligase parkin isoform X1 [Bactrocera neohumeralis]|uniref:E3 ubiquitin-protein ligase parkin isoform X1 n=1 Tax=Bactrocera tryoni TaxID=59916 RepID=UPI001A99E19F|nr:E3 ubiquitin-protein ligase parkin isoform X1 [Bactrocera tryoni]XP_050336123.1 E3 ubiquitin-protein ligase parkin isoform X1 [Bactrocera neohumeralis]